MKVLLSGFEPFGEHSTNPSLELVESLKKNQYPFHLETVILPVSFNSCFEILRDRIDELRPDYVISIGLAAKRENIGIERIAINLIDARIADNEGNQLRDQPVINGAPDGLFSTLPIKKLQKSIEDSGIPSVISDTAGSYVCNYLMYKLINYSKEKDFKGGFIHIPKLETISLDDLVKGMNQMLLDLHAN